MPAQQVFGPKVFDFEDLFDCHIFLFEPQQRLHILIMGKREEKGDHNFCPDNVKREGSSCSKALRELPFAPCASMILPYFNLPNTIMFFLLC